MVRRARRERVPTSRNTRWTSATRADIIARVMPGVTFPAKLGGGAPMKPTRDVTDESAARVAMQPPARNDRFDDEDIDGDIVLIDDAAKAI